jgi:hypothetical protein
MVVAIPARRHIPEDGILHSHRRAKPQILDGFEILKAY